MRVFVGGLVAGRIVLHPWSTVDAAASRSLLRTYTGPAYTTTRRRGWLVADRASAQALLARTSRGGVHGRGDDHGGKPDQRRPPWHGNTNTAG